MKIQRRGEAVLISADGRLDFASCEGLQAEFERELLTGFNALEIDLGATSFVDSAGLGMLLYMDHVCGNGVKVALRGVHGAVLEAIRSSHLDKVLHIEG